MRNSISNIAPKDLRTFDGYITLGESAQMTRYLTDQGIPLVSLTNSIDALAPVQVDTDDIAVGAMAGAYYLERGYEHFAFAALRDIRYSDQRHQGFRQAVESAGFTCHWRYTWEGFTDTAGHITGSYAQATQQWLQSLPRPLALLACSDATALSLVRICRDADIPVPDEVAIMGVDNDDLLCILPEPAISSIQLNGRRIGRVAASLLDRMLNGETPTPGKQPVPPRRVVTRQSTDRFAVADQLIRQTLALIQEQACRGCRGRATD